MLCDIEEAALASAVEGLKRTNADVASTRADVSLKAELQELTDRFGSDVSIDRVALSPKRGAVTVQFVALGWLPSDRRSSGGRRALP